MNGFQKRVALLEKWVPSLLPQLKNIDDMAEIILDVWDEAEAHTEERIIKLLETVCIERGKSWGGYCTLPIDPEHCQECRATFDYIELIKRETNE